MTSSSASSSTTNLPCWATKVVDLRETNTTTSTRSSATLFRVECARIWQQRIHRAQRQAWTETVQHMLHHQKEQHTTTTTTTTTTETSNNCYSLVPPTESELPAEELLPLTLVSLPTDCRLDRQALAEAIWQHHGKSSTLWLPRLLPTLHATLKLLVHAMAANPKQMKRHSSMQQIVFGWAARTTSQVNSMVIVLEDPGGFAQAKVWNEFLTMLVEWRLDHGLPVSLVVLGKPPAFESHGRLLLRCVQPCRTTWFQTFWNDLIMGDTPLPVLSMDRILEWIHSYQLEHLSLTKTCQNINTSITEWFTLPWSMIWNMELHPCFTSWFATHGTAKKWLSTMAASTKLVGLEHCQYIQHYLAWWWKWQAILLPIIFTSGSVQQLSTQLLLEPLAELYSWVSTTQQEEKAPSRLPSEMERYLDRAGKRESSTNDAVMERIQQEQLQARTLLYELIILIGSDTEETESAAQEQEEASPPKRPRLGDKDHTQGIYRMIHDLMEVVIQSMDSLLEDWKDANPLMKHKPPPKKNRGRGSSTNNDMALFRPTRHRQTLVQGLVSPAKELYGLLQDRLSIPREEWLYHFGGSPQDFVRGVWTLALAGLVQAKTKRGGNNGTMVCYEKVSVVWCS